MTQPAEVDPDVETTVTLERHGKTWFHVTTITKKDTEAVERANEFVVRCLLAKLPELLAQAKGV